MPNLIQKLALDTAGDAFASSVLRQYNKADVSDSILESAYDCESVKVVRRIDSLEKRPSLPPNCGVKQVSPYKCEGCRKLVVFEPCQVCAAKLYGRLRGNRR